MKGRVLQYWIMLADHDGKEGPGNAQELRRKISDL